MKSDDERALILAVLNEERPRSAIDRLGLVPKAAWRTLEKWCKKKPPWYEYGVTLDLGWLTPEGKKIAEGLR